MRRKQPRKKAVKASLKPKVVLRRDLQSMAQVLQALAAATTFGTNSVEIIDHEVNILLSADRYSNATAYLSPAFQPVERGRTGGAQKPGEKIRYVNMTKKQVTLTFWNNAEKDDASIAGKELRPRTLTLEKDKSGIVKLTADRENRGHQDIWVGIQVAGLAPGSGTGGGPDMGIDDPQP